MHKGQSKQNAASLFTGQGERKYLNAAERKRFYNAIPVLKEPEERSFCETIYWTGCRPSEALELEVMRVDFESGSLIFRTLKKHGDSKDGHFRSVPVPRDFIKRLDGVHRIKQTQSCKSADQFRRLWNFGRQKGYRAIKAVMNAAGIFGIKACARGLRHSFGVLAIICGIPETRLQAWLGHSSLSTTAIYAEAIGAEDRTLAKKMWA